VQFQAATGAILWLPEGASREDLLSVDPLKALAEMQAPLWQHFAGGRGRGQKRLFVVTGCDKATTFAVLSFTAESRRGSISATVSAGLVDGKFSMDISSTDYHSYDSRVGPRPQSPTPNLCVFLRGFEINPGKDLFKRIGKRVKLPRELFSLFQGFTSSGSEGCPTTSSVSNMEDSMGSQLGGDNLGTCSVVSLALAKVTLTRLKIYRNVRAKYRNKTSITLGLEKYLMIAHPKTMAVS
jgi:hypothetical protein